MMLRFGDFRRFSGWLLSAARTLERTDCTESGDSDLFGFRRLRDP